MSRLLQPLYDAIKVNPCFDKMDLWDRRLTSLALTRHLRAKWMVELEGTDVESFLSKWLKWAMKKDLRRLNTMASNLMGKSTVEKSTELSAYDDDEENNDVDENDNDDDDDDDNPDELAESAKLSVLGPDGRW